ncbi:MAG TPA: substrate-binding domain-containing protein [Trebonia sp.]|nr:substrate-binding domain-containing protein [Trebonia sp.]
MPATRLRRLRGGALLLVMAILGMMALGPASVAQASTYVPIIGAGSTYAYPALNQWATNLESQGLSISYTPNGSASGRQNYLANTVDYAGSDIAFLTKGDADPFAGVDIQQTNFAYSYIPDVAGGLSFLYNLQVDGHKIRNMRLSGKTLAEIFTGQISNWDNPAITHDYGQQLPSIPITVVTRSDGAGESYFLTNWMLKEYSSLWVPYCKAQGGGSLCNTTPTEFYPAQHAGFKALDGAQDVEQYVNSPVNNGAIGYAEYAYAIPDQIPVVSMLNAGGYYVQPTASNVAIALEKAQINEDPSSVDFLMQNLVDVYTDPDPRAYPLSSYSYLIVPRNSRPGAPEGARGFPATKGATLSTYVNYILCQAQQSAGQLGYSPLPAPMVVGGFLQDGHIPGAVKSPASSNYSGCNNPAYENGKDVLTATAPYPNACQKASAPLNCTVVGGKPVSTNSSGNGGGNSSNGGAGSPTGGSSKGPSGSTTNNGPSSGPSSGVKINPNTGQVESGTSATNTDVNAVPVGLASSPQEQWLFGSLTAVVLLAVIAVPTLLGASLQRAGRRQAYGSGGSGGQPGSASNVTDI